MVKKSKWVSSGRDLCWQPAFNPRYGLGQLPAIGETALIKTGGTLSAKSYSLVREM